MLLLGGDEVSVSDPIAVGQGAAAARDRGALGLGDQRPRRHPLADRLGDRRWSRAGRCASSAASPGSRSATSSVWVASPRTGEVLRIDGDAGTIEDRIEVGGRPGALVFGGDRVWVADEDGRGVTAINAQGGRVFKRGHRAPRRAAAPRGRRRRRLGEQRRDRHRAPHRPRHRASPARRSLVGRGPSGVTVGGGVVWVANSRSDSVTRVDPVDPGAARRADPGRRPAGRHRRRHQLRLGRQREGRHGQPHRHRERRDESATRSRSAATRAPSRSAAKRSG